METTRVTTVLFRNTITQEEVFYLRGVVIRMADYAVVFHNHLPDKLQYTYPLVQYKQMGGRAAIVGINKGAKAIELLFGEGGDMECCLGKRSEVFRVDSICTRFQQLCMTGQCYTYSLESWMPFNSENNKKYATIKDEAEQIDMLEHILVGNILSVSKCLKIFYEGRVFCSLLEWENMGNTCYKGMEMKCFSAKFRCNVLLPDYIGLGRGVSTGHGTIIQIR